MLSAPFLARRILAHEDGGALALMNSGQTEIVDASSFLVQGAFFTEYNFSLCLLSRLSPVGSVMKLLLVPSPQEDLLTQMYARALREATELFIVNAYLTDWKPALGLGAKCKTLRIIVGKDYGITRKSACEDVLKWLPKSKKASFLVADRIGGFHPKAVIWKDGNGKGFAIVGSSNLTKAAFNTNYEANFYSKLSVRDYQKAREWIATIEEASVPVSKDWLSRYVEAEQRGGGRRGGRSAPPVENDVPIVGFGLPLYPRASSDVRDRRKQLKWHEAHRRGLRRLFRQCANATISKSQFYEKLNEYWSYKEGNRLQGKGWEMKGKGANLRELSQSLVSIVDASSLGRDDMVVTQIDYLATRGNEARKAFLSEMLCLEFPKLYPILNGPIRRYLSAIKFRAPYGSSEGARYLDLARKLRAALAQNPDHPAKNLAELDTVIQHKYGKKYKNPKRKRA